MPGEPLPPPGFPGPPADQSSPIVDKGRSRRPWVVVAVAAAVVAIVAVTAVVLSGGDDSPTEITSGSTEPESTDAPETTEPESTDASESTEDGQSTIASESTDAPETTVEPSAPGEEATRCRYLGLDDFDDMQVELEFVNPLGVVPAVEVAYALLDGEGTRFHTGSESFDLPQANESFRASADTVTELPPDVDGDAVTCEVLDVGEGFGFDDIQSPPPASECRFDDVDDFGDIQITLSTTSPFDTTEDLFVYYALRGAGGVRFDDSSVLVEFVAPGDSIRLAEDTLTSVPDWATTDDISCEIIGVGASGF